MGVFFLGGMMEVKSRLGFGAYRVSVRSQVHYEALLEALKSGVDLIDTSANYTNGESEKLIGKVLAENPLYNPTIVTKGGYIQGDNLKLLETLQKENKACQDLVEINEHLCHSIHPEFLQTQIDLSLERLGVEKIDCYLLHNPEYYLKTENSKSKEMYERIEKAFLYLEDQVNRGVIGCYGISSNSFVLPQNHKEFISFKLVLDIAFKLELKGFKVVQFPFNLLEVGALDKENGELSLIELANLNGIKTLVNRPLNAFKDDRLVRLATYDKLYELKNLESVMKEFEDCLDKLQIFFDEEGEKIRDLPIIKQLTEIIPTLISNDGVEQVFYGYFFPFIARVFGRDLSAKESQPFYDLFESMCSYARFNQNEVAKKFEEQANESGLLDINDKRDLSVKAIDTLLQKGVDHVLVGMKHSEYVKNLKELI